jgi:predicted esterase
MSELGFVHRYVPPKDGTPLTLLLLHGTGGNENDLLPLGAQLAPGAGLLSPLGKVRENGMPRFFRRLAEGVFDQVDLRLRTEELADFVAGASAHYGFDPGRVIALGYSNGANIAASILMTVPETLKGGALLHAMVPFVPEVAPDLRGKQIFLGAGQNDPIVPRNETIRLERMLSEFGADVETDWFASGHQLSAAELKAAGAWLSRFQLS